MKISRKKNQADIRTLKLSDIWICLVDLKNMKMD